MAGKIIEIVRSKVGLPDTVNGVSTPTVFTIGKGVIDGGSPVIEILFHRDGVVKGMEPCYTVRFDGDEVRAIPERCIVEVARIEPSKKKDAKEEDAA